MKIGTERLELIAGDGPLTRADLENRPLFSQLLSARVPKGWPPPLNDESSQRWLADFHAQHPAATGWGVWYFVLTRPERVLIGNGGFKGLPTAQGVVEIGYSVMEEYQNAGLGSEAVKALIGWAYSKPDVLKIIANTFPELKPSIRVLQKNGFCFDGPGPEPRSVRYCLPRRGA